MTALAAANELIERFTCLVEEFARLEHKALVHERQVVIGQRINYVACALVLVNLYLDDAAIRLIGWALIVMTVGMFVHSITAMHFITRRVKAITLEMKLIEAQLYGVETGTD